MFTLVFLQIMLQIRYGKPFYRDISIIIRRKFIKFDKNKLKKIFELYVYLGGDYP